MQEKVQEAKHQANQAQYLYQLGSITKEEALERVTPYVELHNEAATRIAKEYKMRPRTITAKSFLRSPIR